MFNPPNLSQSQQPKAYYDYDGISGSWLRFPWWIHIGVAILAWPLCWWLLPLLPFQNVKITYFLETYKIQLASAISILTVMTAVFSYIKALRIKKRDAAQPRKNESVANTAKKAVRKRKAVTSEVTTKSKTNVNSSIKKTAVPKKKRVVKKKNDKQASLNFDE